MQSIDKLRAQVNTLKAQSKGGYQTAQIKNLKVEKREQELIVDFLKSHLKDTNGLTDEEVDDLVIKKTTGGPKRFRPKTREELSKEIRKLTRNLAKAETLIKKKAAERTLESTASKTTKKDIANVPASSALQPSTQQNEGNARLASEVATLRDQLEEIRINLVAKTKALELQDHKVEELHGTVREFGIVQNKYKRLRDKYATMKQHMFKLRDASIEAAVEQEKLNERLQQVEMEKNLLQEEIMQRTEDVGDSELKHVNEISELRKREVTLLDEIDDLKLQIATEKQEQFERSRKRETSLIQSASEIGQERELRAKAEAGLEFMNKKAAKLQQKLEDMSSKLVESNKNFENLQQEHAGLNNDLQQALRTVQSHANRIAELEEHGIQSNQGSRELQDTDRSTGLKNEPTLFTRSKTIGLSNPIFSGNGNDERETVNSSSPNRGHSTKDFTRLQEHSKQGIWSKSSRNLDAEADVLSKDDMLKMTEEVHALAEKLRITEHDLEREKLKADQYKQIAETAQRRLSERYPAELEVDPLSRGDNVRLRDVTPVSGSSSSSRSSSDSSMFTSSASLSSTPSSSGRSASQMNAGSLLVDGELRDQIDRANAMIHALENNVQILRKDCAQQNAKNEFLEERLRKQLQLFQQHIRKHLESQSESGIQEALISLDTIINVELKEAKDEVDKLQMERDYQENLFLTLKTMLEIMKSYAISCHQQLSSMGANPHPVPDLEEIAKQVTMLGRHGADQRQSLGVKELVEEDRGRIHGIASSRAGTQKYSGREPISLEASSLGEQTRDVPAHSQRSGRVESHQSSTIDPAAHSQRSGRVESHRTNVVDHVSHSQRSGRVESHRTNVVDHVSHSQRSGRVESHRTNVVDHVSHSRPSARTQSHRSETTGTPGHHVLDMIAASARQQSNDPSKATPAAASGDRETVRDLLGTMLRENGVEPIEHPQPNRYHSASSTRSYFSKGDSSSSSSRSSSSSSSSSNSSSSSSSSNSSSSSSSWTSNSSSSDTDGEGETAKEFVVHHALPDWVSQDDDDASLHRS